MIGAGASGLLAAGRAAELGAGITLLEKMDKLGLKMLASGSGRCNLSNARDMDDFISAFGPNGRFLYPAFHHFFRPELLNLLNRYGVNTSVESGGRIFPSSGRSSDVVQALALFAQDNGVNMITGADVSKIDTRVGHVSSVHVQGGASHAADAVVLAAGGSSYPQTGSTGDGYKMAASLGHSIIRLRPALVPLVVEESGLARALQGISLKGARVTSFACRSGEIDIRAVPEVDAGRGLARQKLRPPLIESRRGDVLFTHFGLSGPAVLLMSLAVVDALETNPVSISIDLLPDTPEKQLVTIVERLFTQHGSRLVKNVLESFAPARIIAAALKNTGGIADKKASQVSLAERKALCRALKDVRFNIRGPRPLSQAMVTAGGVCLDEVDPRTMESRLVKGLYLCGEVLDLDADTGGFNLQAAFSTGYLAGESTAKPD